MARKIKFALEMSDGTKIRSNIEELREHFDIESIMGYFLSGKLQEWLEDRYYENEANEIAKINKDDNDIRMKVCRILGVEPPSDEDFNINIIEKINCKKSLLRQITDDETIIEHVQHVAFNQEELAELIDQGESIIYLYGKNFTLPANIKNKTYIGINMPSITINVKSSTDLLNKNIKLKNVILPESLSASNIPPIQETKSDIELQSLSFYERTKQLYGKDEADAEKLYLECKYDGLLDKFIVLSNKGVERANYFIVQMYCYSYGDAVLENNINSNARKICDNCSDILAKVQGTYLHSKETGEFEYVVDSIIGDLRKMADDGDPFACHELDCLFRGGYKKITQEEGKKYINKASDIGNMDATFWIARNAELAGEYDKAIRYYEKASRNSHPVAQNNLGYMYECGLGVNKDLKKAFNLYNSSAQKGCVWGQDNLADCYYNGKGTTHDNDKAAFWYQKAAEKNYAESQNMLGVCYFIQQDYQSAFYWQKKAAEQGLWAAQRNLAGLIFDSEDYGLGKLDSYDGIEWLERAIDEGDNIAMKQLADYYMRETFLLDHEDITDAYNLYIQAANSGNEEAKEVIKNIEATDKIMKMRAFLHDIDYIECCPLLLREIMKKRGYLFATYSDSRVQDTYRHELNFYTGNESEVKAITNNLLISYAKGYNVDNIACIYVNYDHMGIYTEGHYVLENDSYKSVPGKCIRGAGVDDSSLWILTCDAIILHDTNGFLYIKEKSFWGNKEKTVNDLKIPYSSITSVEIINQNELIILYDDNKNIHINLEARNRNDGIGCWTEIFTIAKFISNFTNSDNQ